MNQFDRRDVVRFGISAGFAHLAYSSALAQESDVQAIGEKKDTDSQPMAIAGPSVKEFPYDAGTVRMLFSRDAAGRQSSIIELAELPGYKTPLHRHKGFDETYFVIDGLLTAQVEEKVYQLPKGSLLFLPRGVAHAQGNFTEAPVKTLLTLTPGGFEKFFGDRVELHKTIGPDHPEFVSRMTAIAEKHDLEFLSWWDPKLSDLAPLEE